jgi:hypothetical protein
MLFANVTDKHGLERCLNKLKHSCSLARAELSCHRDLLRRSLGDTPTASVIYSALPAFSYPAITMGDRDH